MIKLLLITLFSISFTVFGQFTDTASMRVIEQTRTAQEGDLYLDTVSKIYKIGLTTGKLGLLSDDQNIDSLAVINDSLFVFISGNNKVGLPLSSLQKDNKIDTGLTYYVWGLPNNNQPDISTVSQLGVSSSQGKTQSALNDNLRIALEPANNRFIFLFTGTIKVENTGTFNFESTSQDGTRVYIDDVLVIDNWSNRNSNITVTNAINLAKGEHKIEFWYYQSTGQRFMEFKWGSNPDGYATGSEIKATQFFIK